MKLRPFIQFAPRLERGADWREQALCALPEHRPTRDRDLWHSNRDADKAEALNICAACPVQAKCAELGDGEQWGIWGGKSKRTSPTKIIPCATCNYPTRPNGARAVDYPGTRQRNAGDLCSRCYDRKIYGYKPRQPAFEAGTPCVGCQQPLRPAKTLLTDYPNTVLNRGYGRCHTCHKQMKRDQK